MTVFEPFSSGKPVQSSKIVQKSPKSRKPSFLHFLEKEVPKLRQRRKKGAPPKKSQKGPKKGPKRAQNTPKKGGRSILLMSTHFWGKVLKKGGQKARICSGGKKSPKKGPKRAKFPELCAFLFLRIAHI